VALFGKFLPTRADAPGSKMRDTIVIGNKATPMGHEIYTVNFGGESDSGFKATPMSPVDYIIRGGFGEFKSST